MKEDAKRKRDKQKAIQEKKGKEDAKVAYEKELEYMRAKFKEATDPASKRKYWYNQETMETTWDDPFVGLKRKYKGKI